MFDLLSQYEAEGHSLPGHIISGDETWCIAEVRGSKGNLPAAHGRQQSAPAEPRGGSGLPLLQGALRRGGRGRESPTSGLRGAWRGSGRRRPLRSCWPWGAAEVRGRGVEGSVCGAPPGARAAGRPQCLLNESSSV